MMYFEYSVNEVFDEEYTLDIFKFQEYISKVAYFKSINDFESALKCYEEILELDKNNEKTFLYLADFLDTIIEYSKTLIDRNKLGEARLRLNELIAIEDENLIGFEDILKNRKKIAQDILENLIIITDPIDKLIKEKWALDGKKPRKVQIKLIKKIYKAIKEGYKNIVLDAGTGIGKSAIATTIANIFGDAYILTMTKQLQTQYINDFANYACLIMGKGNYNCHQIDTTCEFCSKEAYGQKKCENCEYQIALGLARKSEIVVTNYDYIYTAGVKIPNRFFKRELLILDESHNLENKMMNFGQTLKNHYIEKNYGIDIFEGFTNKDFSKLKKDFEFWINICKDLINICDAKIKSLKPNQFVTKKKLKQEKENFKDIIKGLDTNHYLILINNTRWGPIVNFKPKSIIEETRELLNFGDIRLFLTGTLGDYNKFCEWLDLDKNETCYIYEKSPFSIDNRPIYLDFIKSMSSSRWKSKDVIKKIEEILSKYPNQKGVIHTSSTQQANWLKKQLNDDKFKVAAGKNRENDIKEFEESSDSLVLIGPALKDGVDFKDDKCRFQIIFKMPFPRLDDQIKVIIKQDNEWYPYHTIMPLMQAYGRGIRHENDYCDAYIIDSDFRTLYSNYKKFFNEYFIEAIKEK